MSELTSVIVPMKNAAPYIEECLQSILSQKAISAEIIVIDDQSTDQSRAIISGIGDERIRIVDGSAAVEPVIGHNRSTA